MQNLLIPIILLLSSCNDLTGQDSLSYTKTIKCSVYYYNDSTQTKQKKEFTISTDSTINRIITYLKESEGNVRGEKIIYEVALIQMRFSDSINNEIGYLEILMNTPNHGTIARYMSGKIGFVLFEKKNEKLGQYLTNYISSNEKITFDLPPNYPK